MDTREILGRLSAMAGPSGFERAVAMQAADLMRPFLDEANVDRFGNAVGVRLCGCETPGTVEEKTALILNHGLALWDVLESCTIEGAQDATIKDPVPVDLKRVLDSSPIEAVFCNGAAAYTLYGRFLQPVSGISAVKLPSTSPANAAWSPDRLAAAWGAALGQFLG